MSTRAGTSKMIFTGHGGGLGLPSGSGMPSMQCALSVLALGGFMIA